MDLDIISASVVASLTAATTSSSKAAESIQAGDVVIRTDAGMVKASAADSALIDASGIALVNCEVGQPCPYVTQDSDFNPGATVPLGSALYMSATPGKMTTDLADLPSGSIPVIVGAGIGGDKASINFSDPMPFKATDPIA